eukprot:CAMPEP_0172422670 /NCGR_PEP_ID=MMETSP1064-20121228/8798_1 /TAXON_ID=202472 /ORGANISM="Aulacoseira subarctica , Strain CCAP 1002/5" /LENGTH=400 /DNA_ID=CAMNT_0013163633 /DNA_START=207 /DNA_END=1409 /DNA_ORIENTATION=-
MKNFILKIASKVETLNDINMTREAERCASYGFGYDNRTMRRRVFMGALIADDPWDTIEAIAAKGYGIYHTVAFIESNTTQSYFPRELRFTPGSFDLALLQRDELFGPDTIVTVDFYFDSMNSSLNSKDPLVREHMQRDRIAPRWKMNGMQPDDIGIVMDTDETFSRDFLHALQICDVPEFRPDQDCRSPKILASTIVFEGIPECIVREKLLWHPDAVLGECIEYIGNETLHPPVLREFNGIHGKRAEGYGRNQNFDKMPNVSLHPLLSAGDFRNYEGGRQIGMVGQYNWTSVESDQPIGATGYHFHNFFANVSTIRRKYRTYGHPQEHAFEEKPLGQLEIYDLSHAINCTMGQPHVEQISTTYDQMIGPKPLYFTDEYRKRRSEFFRRIIEEDEQEYSNK